MPPHSTDVALAELPLVGRSDDLDRLRRLFGTGPDTPPLFVVTGETGVGKSRLVGVVADEARRRGWRVAHGRAYPVETGMPYALLSDALLPLLREMDDATLTVLTRGRAGELRRLFPALGPEPDLRAAGEDPEELRSRLYWNFTEFLTRLSEREPLLLVLEDLHCADPSSLALVHFLVRQLGEDSLRVLASYNTDYRDANEHLLSLERSLLALRRLRAHAVRPLSHDETVELLARSFGVSGPPLEAFGELLYGWTRGNPYFVEQVVQALVDSGKLHRRDGVWLGWESRELALPDTIRDAVLVRFQGLDPVDRRVADVLSVVGAPTPPALVAEVADVEGEIGAAAVDRLVGRGLLEERRKDGRVVVEFRHPLAQETLYQEISLTRREGLHRAVGEALETALADARDAHADELAYHFSRGGALADDPRAARYLARAGRHALERHADREAAAYLASALDSLAAGAALQGDEAVRIRHDLARARARLGQFDAARTLWRELGEDARNRGDARGVARAERHLGLLAYWTGRPRIALDHYDSAREALGDAAPAVTARLDLAAGVALQEMGDPDGSRERVDRALALGEALDDPGLRARAHRALALLETWVGAAETARRHGWKAVELSRLTHDDHVAFWGRWALATLEGLTGDTEAMARLMEEARGIAADLRSPVLSLWVAELDVELAYARGDWDGALARGEQAIRLAEALNQGTLLARLEVWTAMVYIGRGDLERAEELVERAWNRAGADERGSRSPDLHAVLPAHIGRAALHLARDEHARAIEVGERGMEIADRSGYVVWVLHRLLPIVGEAYLRARDLDGARRVGERLRREGQRMGHSLGLAWAEACDAILAWVSGDVAEGARLLRSAAEGLESIPMIPEAARLRRQLAGRLADLDDREGALAELRRVHEIFGSLGAEAELLKARDQFRELDARPPSRTEAEGTADLTPREVEVAALVADRLSNKAVAKALDVSPRTVTTHLSNIYRKLDIGSRQELVDRIREGRLPLTPPSPRAE